jgi:tetratricopeptide (TPR) repeat protein
MTRQQVVDLIEQAYRETKKLVDALSEAERFAIGTVDHWAAKDMVAHLVVSQADVVETLIAPDRPAPPQRDFNEVNAENFERYRHTPWADILAEWERGHARLMERLQAMSEEELDAPFQFSWQAQPQPMWRGIVGSGHTHPIVHLAQFYIERGDLDRAIHIQEQSAQGLVALDDSPAQQGTVLYNLACFYALGGAKDKALAKLEQAFKLNPNLASWSKQDSDLARLHADAAYLALVEAVLKND